MKHFVMIMAVCFVLLLGGCLHETPPTTTGDPPVTDDKVATSATETSQAEHEHRYNLWQEIAPTCTEYGYTLMSCSCGASMRGAFVGPKGHEYQISKVVAPTQTEGGYTVFACHCGDSYRTGETDPLMPQNIPDNMFFTKNEEGHLLYYYAKNGKRSEMFVACNEPVECYNDDGVFGYFVKESEPERLYYAPMTNVTTQQVIYESGFGTINFIESHEFQGAQGKYVTLTEGNKRVVLLDLLASEITVLVEVYYVQDAWITWFDTGAEEPDVRWVLLFECQPTENDKKSDYSYIPETGEFQEFKG